MASKGRPFMPGHPGGPGRPKLTPQKRAEKKALLEYYRQYLERGEAVVDHKRGRKKNPLAALKQAEDRIYGQAPQKVEQSINLGAIQIVYGDDGSEKSGKEPGQ